MFSMISSLTRTGLGNNVAAQCCPRAATNAGGVSWQQLSKQPVRFATKKAGGTTKNGRDSPGKRLGVKKFGGEVVVPGNIIIRKRGQKFRAGENVGMGKDHTIFALAPGNVQFQFDHRIKRQIVSVVPKLSL